MQLIFNRYISRKAWLTGQPWPSKVKSNLIIHKVKSQWNDSRKVITRNHIAFCKHTFKVSLIWGIVLSVSWPISDSQFSGHLEGGKIQPMDRFPHCTFPVDWDIMRESHFPMGTYYCLCIVLTLLHNIA